MVSDISGSFNSIFKERMTSPLYGAFILSWLAWNWQIVYATLFVDEDMLGINRIEWILNNHSEWQFLILYPIFSAIFLVTIMPFITNGAYWLSLRFRKWRIDTKNEIENKTLLTIEQSIALREELLRKDERIEKMLESKNKEIKQLDAQVTELEKQLSDINNEDSKNLNLITDVNDDRLKNSIFEIVDKIMSDKEIESSFNTAIEYIQGGYSGLVKDESVSSSGLAYLEANDIVESRDKGMFKLTDKGKEVLRVYLDSRN